ncbi:unnamed protein product [Pieris macdunnoughi]|uniref:Uncharacterized protein n=1 Tax=Pieris macdunnoughi TaxID=345717 RepID=A0A821L2F7_9NEOP|nr:unnamed protein product [Pieris macdunnoughi]
MEQVSPSTSLLFVVFCSMKSLLSNINAVPHHLRTAKLALLFLTELFTPDESSFLSYPVRKLRAYINGRAKSETAGMDTRGIVKVQRISRSPSTSYGRIQLQVLVRTVLQSTLHDLCCRRCRLE